MSVGTAVAVIAYISQVFTPLESIGMEIETIQSAVAGVRRINGFLAQAERIPTAETAPQAVPGAPAWSCRTCILVMRAMRKCCTA